MCLHRNALGVYIEMCYVFTQRKLCVYIVIKKFINQNINKLFFRRIIQVIITL
jgi:hypothetical protein